MSLTSKGPLFLRISVPEGLDAALEGLAREVLKQQPRDIYWFAAQHFETLVRLRNMGGEYGSGGINLVLSVLRVRVISMTSFRLGTRWG